MPNSPPVQSLTIPAITKHTATVILVHGLGDSGHGLTPIADMFRTDPGISHIKWIFPHAPSRPVAANLGMIMPSWFDVKSFAFGAAEDEEGMMRAVDSLSQIVRKEIELGVPSTRIVIGGFSQGSTISLLAGLTQDLNVRGVVTLSGWVPLQHKFKGLSQAALSTSIFWGQGSNDPIIKLPQTNESLDVLRDAGFKINSGVVEPTDVSFNYYQGAGHRAVPEELHDLKEWLKMVLPQ
ncbi:lysophospholipase I [Dendrothele bispora CBS 962.96]|uniref:Acyl-protein thioesterase 1 n=1 Tax=Dendrothele bispora (strain CBS 962.96) TaxID=1314807 RepID=A0A4S8MXS9_DENBC|nr:lysophospholipase I [Dendrothele bispora CBS 962.96]